MRSGACGSSFHVSTSTAQAGQLARQRTPSRHSDAPPFQAPAK